MLIFNYNLFLLGNKSVFFNWSCHVLHSDVNKSFGESDEKSPESSDGEDNDEPLSKRTKSCEGELEKLSFLFFFPYIILPFFFPLAYPSAIALSFLAFPSYFVIKSTNISVTLDPFP